MHCPITDKDIDKFRAIFEKWTVAGMIFDVIETRMADGVIAITVEHLDTTAASSQYVAYEFHKIDGGKALFGRRNIYWVAQLYVCQGLNFMLPEIRGCVVGDSIKSALREAKKDAAKNFQSQVTLDEAIAKCMGSFADWCADTWTELVDTGREYQQRRLKSNASAEKDRMSSMLDSVKESYDEVIGSVVRAWYEIFGDRTGTREASGKAIAPLGKLTISEVSRLLAIQAYRIGQYATTAPSAVDIKKMLEAPLDCEVWRPDLAECVRSFCYLTAATMYECADYHLSVAYRQKAKEISDDFSSTFSNYIQILQYRALHPEELSRTKPLDLACRALHVDQRDPKSLECRFLKLNLKEILSSELVMRLMDGEYIPQARTRQEYSSNPSPPNAPKQTPLTEDQILWKGWHVKHKWVVLDRDIPVNLPDSKSRSYWFIRLSDMEVFGSDQKSWKAGGEFLHFIKHLQTVESKKRPEEEKKLEGLVALYLKNRSKLQGKILESVEYEAVQTIQNHAYVENVEEIFEDDNCHPYEEITKKKSHSEFEDLLLERQRSDAERIRSLIDDREIPYLVHFTRVENIEGILKNGIVPRALLKDSFTANDNDRFDGFPEASSCSLSFPNYRMLYSYRCKAPSDWAVICIETDVLTQLPCLFFPDNAASAKFKNLHMSVNLHGVAGLENMFRDSPVGIRKKGRMEEWWTTNPEAEVLLFGVIRPEMFSSIHVRRNNRMVLDLINCQRPNLRLVENSPFFSPRADYALWTQTSDED